MRLDKNFLTETHTLQIQTNAYINIKRSKGYTGEFKKGNCDDSDLSVTLNLKAAAAKKMRLHVTGYFQGEHIYMVGKDRLIMNYKEYGMNKQKPVTAL